MNTQATNRSMPSYRAELLRAQSRAFKRLCRSGARAITRTDAALNRLRADLARALVNSPSLLYKVDSICERAREAVCDEIVRSAMSHRPHANHERIST